MDNRAAAKLDHLVVRIGPQLVVRGAALSPRDRSFTFRFLIRSQKDATLGN
jgi:hypothetical protein